MSFVGMYFIFVVLIAAAFADEELPEAAAKEWWRTAAVYQVYPLSLKDSDNDGKGDLKGITEKIPYLKETGLDAIWISPIYPSPMADFGYDISNYTGIHEWYGTMDDFDNLVNVIHESGMKLIMDLVPNHSSDKHEWFIKSENREPGFEDYYVWKDPKGTDSSGRPIPPNNWVSVFYGPAWTYSEKRKQFYRHSFLKAQPDLNFRNPKVVEEINNVILFWLGRGVDGFRIDAIPFVFENNYFLDEPTRGQSGADPFDYSYLDHIYTEHQPETYEMVQQWRELVDRENRRDGKDRALMVEAYGDIPQTMAYFGQPNRPGAHFPFNFHLLGLNENSSALFVKQQINSWFDNLPPHGHSNWVVGNHDQHRVGSKIGEDLIDGVNMMLLLLPGTSVTYYGEEIGMVNNDDIMYEEGVDPQGQAYPKEQYRSKSRDFERTPFQWDATTNAGFNQGGKPWLPINKNYEELNLDAQYGKPYSHYTIFTDLTRLRKTSVIQNGETLVETVGNGTLEIIRSLATGDCVVVLINFSKEEDQISLDTSLLYGKDKLKIYTTHSESGYKKGDIIDSSDVKLPGRSAVVLTTSTV